jgi:hypothetical protein
MKAGSIDPAALALAAQAPELVLIVPTPPSARSKSRSRPAAIVAVGFERQVKGARLLGELGRQRQ